MSKQYLGVAALALSCVLPNGVAAQSTEVWTCLYDTGRPAMEFTLKNRRTLESVVYLDAETPKPAIDVLEFFNGGIVKALSARYSPALMFRLEVYRPQGDRTAPFTGQFWPIGSSGSRPVSCSDQP